MNLLEGNDDWLLWQLADSAFPTGSFAHSGGLEAAWQYGEISNASDLETFIEAALWQAGCGTIPFVVAAHESPGNFDECTARCDAFLSNHVANRASRLQGRAFVNSAARIFVVLKNFILRADVCHFAPAFGVVARRLSISLENTRQLYFFQTLRTLISSAIRLGIVGPMEAQGMQHRLAPRARRILDETRGRMPDEVTNTAPLLDIWQGSQDRLYSRLFQT